MNASYNRVARRRHRGQRGFTLIELLVVIAVLGILAGVVIFNIVGVSGRGSSAACQTDLKTVQTAVIAYYSDNSNAYPTSGGTVPGEVVMTDLTPNYMHTIPSSTGTVTLDANGTATAANC